MLWTPPSTPPVRCQISQRIDRPEEQLAAPRRRRAVPLRRPRGSRPASAPRNRSRSAARSAGGSGPRPPRRQGGRRPARRAGVLPDDRVVDRAPGPPRPDDGGLALVADADGGQRTRVGPRLTQRDPDAGPHALEDLVGVVLDPAGSRRDLGMLQLVAGDRLPAPGRRGCSGCSSSPDRWRRRATAAGPSELVAVGAPVDRR